MGTRGTMGISGSPERRVGRRRLAALVLGAAVLAGTAACTGTSTPTAGGGSSPATTASTGSGGTGTQSAPASSATAGSTTGTSGVHSASSPGSGSKSAAACTGAQIKTTLGRAGVAMNHHAISVTFTNVGAHACTLHGYPGAAIVSGSKTLLDATRELNGYIGDEQQLSAVPTVTLAPGAVASAILESEGSAGEKCYPDGNGTLEVTPPNTTAVTPLEPMKLGNLGMCADFEVHPVVPGKVGD